MHASETVDREVIGHAHSKRLSVLVYFHAAVVVFITKDAMTPGMAVQLGHV